MSEVDKLFKKTVHSAKVVPIYLDPEGGLPWFAFVQTKEREGPPRKPDKNGKPQKPFIRRRGWSLPGGGVEAEDYELPENLALKNYAFRHASQRELYREGGIIQPIEAFSEKHSLHVLPVESDRRGSDYLETHYYLVILDALVQHVPITETDEVTEMTFFQLDKIPLPDTRLEPIATFITHIRNIEKLLQFTETRFEDADLWLKAFREKFHSYLY